MKLKNPPKEPEQHISMMIPDELNEGVMREVWGENIEYMKYKKHMKFIDSLPDDPGELILQGDYQRFEYQRYAYEKCYRQFNQKRRGSFIYGSSGSGKTFIVARLAYEFSKDYNIEFIDVSTFLQKLHSGIQTRKTIEMIDDILKLDVIIFDDLGKEVPSDWQMGKLFLIINHFASHGKIILTTLNYTPKDLALKFGTDKGQTLISRLAGNCEIIRLEHPEGKDLRVHLK